MRLVLRRISITLAWRDARAVQAPAPPETPGKAEAPGKKPPAEADVPIVELSLSTRPMSSEELGDFIRSEQQLWKPVIKQIGVAMQ